MESDVSETISNLTSDTRDKLGTNGRNTRASAVLLICSLLDTDTIRRWIKLCDSLGLSALVEAHTADEVYSAIAAGARVIGVNNRNLRDFTMDINNCTKLRELVPDNIIFDIRS